MASDTENVSIWLCHHELSLICYQATSRLNVGQRFACLLWHFYIFQIMLIIFVSQDDTNINKWCHHRGSRRISPSLNMILLVYYRKKKQKKHQMYPQLICMQPGHTNQHWAYWVNHMEAYHYNDIIIGTMASQITSLMIVYSTVYSGADQRKNKSSKSLAFVQGIHRWPVNSLHKWPVMRKMFPFGEVIMNCP